MRQAQLNLVISFLAPAMHVAPEYLLGPSRGSQHLSNARHTLYYLAHIGFGMSYSQIGELVMRDRTSVAHGVTRIEDCRDKPEIDRALHFAEMALVDVFSQYWVTKE